MTKRIIIIVLCVVLSAGALVGVLAYLGSRGGKINVYSVSNISMDSYWGDANETDGNVRYDRMQSVYLSDTQIVTAVSVTAGQEVTAGTPLLTFDTTLTDIELQRKELSVTKLELELKQAREELRRIGNMKPYVAPAPTPAPPEPEKHPIPEDELPYLVEGTEGTLENPYVFLCLPQMEYTHDLVEAMLLGVDQCWAVFQVRQDNALEGEVLSQWAITFKQDESGNVSFELIDAEEILSDEPIEEPQEPVDDSSGYTASEIADMKREQNKRIRDLDLSIRLARVELERMRLEMTSGTVTAQIDGTVVDVLDEETARKENKPIVLLSGGGGYFIDCTIGELDLADVQIGQSVTVNAWESGGTYEGHIYEISDMPAPQEGGYWGGAKNTNVSRYPMVVQVAADAVLREYEWVTVSFQGQEQQQGQSLYLENSFLRTENGKGYVYVMNEEGRLEQRFLKTGVNIWGSYTRILQGLSAEDYIAFPYGRGVKAGAQCVQAPIDELYSGMY